MFLFLSNLCFWVKLNLVQCILNFLISYTILVISNPASEVWQFWYMIISRRNIMMNLGNVLLLLTFQFQMVFFLESFILNPSSLNPFDYTWIPNSTNICFPAGLKKNITAPQLMNFNEYILFENSYKPYFDLCFSLDISNKFRWINDIEHEYVWKEILRIFLIIGTSAYMHKQIQSCWFKSK